MKIKRTCTTPHGVFTRVTDRTYTHVVLFKANNDGSCRTRKYKAGDIVDLSWCGSEKLAQRATRDEYNTRQGELVGIFPVDQ